MDYEYRHKCEGAMMRSRLTGLSNILDGCYLNVNFCKYVSKRSEKRGFLILSL